jgi:hypothetical protein
MPITAIGMMATMEILGIVGVLENSSICPIFASHVFFKATYYRKHHSHCKQDKENHSVNFGVKANISCIAKIYFTKSKIIWLTQYQIREAPHKIKYRAGKPGAGCRT